MSNELHQQPETSVEHRDMRAVTDPRQQKNLATNQGVRFYVSKEMSVLETALLQRLTESFDELSRSMDSMTQDISFLMKETKDMQERLLFLECRWYERIMRYLEWDILSFRIWLHEHGIGSNPIPEEPKNNVLEIEAQVNALPAIEKSEPITNADIDALEQVGAEMSVFSDDVTPEQRG